MTAGFPAVFMPAMKRCLTPFHQTTPSIMVIGSDRVALESIGVPRIPSGFAFDAPFVMALNPSCGQLPCALWTVSEHSRGGNPIKQGLSGEKIPDDWGGVRDERRHLGSVESSPHGLENLQDRPD